ncbi:DUF3592 domain-containing protein, partial [Bacillus subtilis]
MTTSSGSRIGGLLHASLFSLLGLGLLLAG